jgi:hypothetical protein
MLKSVLCIIMLVLALGSAGCTNNPPEAAVQSVANGTESTLNTTVTAATQSTPDPTTLSTLETTQTMPVPMPTAETDVSKITFSDYSDMDFSLDYPSNWQIEESNVDYSTKKISGGDIFKESVRIVAFVSEDNKTKLVATTYDFIATGYRVSNPDIEWCRNSVTAQFPDVNGATAVVNYKYFEDDGRNPTVTYDVILPKSSNWYPHSYSERIVITLHHEYIFDFIAERGDIDAYNNVKDVMFSSIIPNDKNPMGE